MTEFESEPLRGGARVISQAALVLAILAGTIFVVVIVLGSGGQTSVAEVFGPIGVVVTVVGLIVGLIGLANKRTRTLAFISLLVLVPSIFLSFFAIIAAISRGTGG